MRIGWCWILILICAAAHAAGPEPTRLQAQVDIGSRKLELQISVAPPSQAASGEIDAQVDLAPILAEVHAEILRRLPRDSCRRQGADNFVARLRRYSAWVDGEELWFEAELRVEAWGCIEWRRAAMRRRLSHGDLRIRLPLRAQAGPEGLRLRVGRPEVGVRGPLGEAARWYFALRGEELGEALARRAQQLDARRLVLAQPVDWLGSGELKNARFVDAGRPALRLRLRWAPAWPGWFGRLWPWGAPAPRDQ